MLPTENYRSDAPSRDEVDRVAGAVVLDFGTDWCGHCQAAQPLVDAACAGFPQVRHLKIEDGKGRPLGRSFKVTLWPTLIFLDAGVEVARLVRPADADVIRQALARIDHGN
ncbi:thioredoxin family protein [Actimicrobium antarcticum]|uniref:Thioredoxin family protein n=1 Tax=Actimicrobium antarcticum TaxID=1051899 RepID=A0ABP7ST25_9BURK